MEITFVAVQQTEFCSRRFRQNDRPAGGSGAASGVENFADDYVGFERRKCVGLCSVEENRAEICERVVVGSGNRSGGGRGGVRFGGGGGAGVVGGDSVGWGRGGRGLQFLFGVGANS